MKQKLFLTRCIAIWAIIAILFTGCSQKTPVTTTSTAPTTTTAPTSTTEPISTTEPTSTTAPKLTTDPTSTTAPTVSVEPTKPTVKNVIFMIADGGGYDNFTLADKVKSEMVNRGITKLPGAKTEITTNLLADAGMAETKGLYLNSLLVGSANTLLQVPNGDANTQKSYITDSAAAGTALSSGYKTSYSYVGITSDMVPRASLSELARMKGMSTGVVTNKSFVDATPLAFFTAHSIHRKDNINNSMQALLSGVDVLIGEGTEYGDLWGIDDSTHPDITPSKLGYTVARSKTQLLTQAATATKLWAPILGVDNSFNELKEYEYDTTTDHISYDVDAKISSEQPSLLDMTKAALQVLENINDPEGFFLMIEGGALDNAAEGGHLFAAVGEYLAFDEAFGYCVSWATERGDTLVIAVPDHDSGGFFGIESCEEALIDGIINGKIGSQKLDSTMNFRDITDALEDAGANTENMKYMGGHTDMAVPICMYAPDSIRLQLLENMTLPTAGGDVRTGTLEYYAPNESGDLTQYASSALNKDYLIDNTKIAPAIAKTLALGSLDEASAALFNLVSSTESENGKLTFPEPPLSNSCGDYYAVTYQTTDNSLLVSRNSGSFTLNGQKKEIQKIGNQLPMAIFVTTDLDTPDEGSFYVPASVLAAAKAG